jgi:signal transduction histidine kinase
VLLDRALGDLERTRAFDEIHRLVELQLFAIANGSDDHTGQQLLVQIDRLIELSPPGDRETSKRLVDFRGYLRGADFDRLRTAGPPSPAHQALNVFHEIAISESRSDAELVAELEGAIQDQLRYEMAAPLALVILCIVAVPIVRRRIVRPLETFGEQVSGIAKGDFTPTPAEHLDAHTLPLHRNLIKLAVRLEELEREHLRREATLEDEVRTATQTLLEQQHSLARAERLAVAGELAANVAHEVRNPLAGIQMSLTNLRNELESPGFVERVDAVIEEVVRLTRLVNEIVDASRHVPESPVDVDVAELIDDLISLTRYQLPQNIALESRIEEGLHARTSKERLRQALLNLVLNSASAIGDAPGRISIEAERVPEGLRIVVTDDGPGFPSSMLENGIRPFYSTRTGGTGLGLAMVRRFAREAEGRLELARGEGPESRPGARVSLLLPSSPTHG